VEGSFDHVALFSETPSRAVVSTGDPETVIRGARAAGLDTVVLGSVGGDQLQFGSFALALDDAISHFEGVIPTSLSASME
jgi:hypothetical protein